MSKEMMLSKRFSEAVEFARLHHEGHTRKGTTIPYLNHLLTVAGLAIEDAAADPELQDQVEDIAIAALLHDVLEDTEVTADELEAAFGSVVREIVEECSDAEGPGNKPPWLLRKQQYLDDLEFASDAALCVALADKRHNALSSVVDAQAEGPEFWARFSAGPQDQIWWYRAVASIIGFWRPGRAAQELTYTVERLCKLANEAVGLSQPHWELADNGSPGPTSRSYWVVDGRFAAGAYPGDGDWKPGDAAPAVVGKMLSAGLNCFVNLTEDLPGGGDSHLNIYDPFVSGQALVDRKPIPDMGIPTVEHMVTVLDAVDQHLRQGGNVYVHCWGGLGRTGTVVACWMIRHGLVSPEDALEELTRLRLGDAGAGHRRSPQTSEQCLFVTNWKEGQ